MTSRPTRYELAANRNLLRENAYPGRGIVQGLTKSGARAVQAYWVMGRSEFSRARVLQVADDQYTVGTTVKTAGFNLPEEADTSLIIYNAMRDLDDRHIVSNGDQTDTIFDGLLEGESFEASLETREYEPDDPNFTPRISGIIDLSNPGERVPTAKLLIIKRVGDEASRRAFRTELRSDMRGIGHVIHTYKGDGSPLPAFDGHPRRIQIGEDTNEIADDLWSVLNSDNRVALAVRTIDLETGDESLTLRNKNLGN